MSRFEALIDEHHDEIYHYIWRMLGSQQSDGPVAAADVTQEVFIRAYGAFERLPADSNYRAWLYKIATNTTYTVLRRRSRDQNRTTGLPDEPHRAPADDALLPDQQLTQAETLAELGTRINRLPDKQRSAVILRYLHELPYADVAEALDCSEDSARANVYQGLKRLRLEMNEEQDL